MSNSIILTNLLSDENNKFSTDVQNLLDIKLNKFKEIIKKHVSECITENIDNFYNQANLEFEDEIFDKTLDCVDKTFFTSNLSDEGSVPIFLNKNDYDNKKCFHFCDDGNGGYEGSKYFWVFRTFVLIKYSYYSGYSYKYLEHNIPIHVLYIIKTFLPFRSGQIRFREFIHKFSRLDNQKFYPNSMEFEKICKTEYSNIQNIKDELQEKQIELNNLIQIQKDNAKYYNDLELKFKEFEKEKELFEENKKKLVVAKQKINEMKNNLDREKLLFEKEKQEFHRISNTIILDDFLTDDE